MQAQENILGTKKTSAHASAGQNDLLARIYREYPNDVFELIASICLTGWGGGGLNIFRLANKRCKQATESCTKRLTNLSKEDGPDLLPITVRDAGGLSGYDATVASSEAWMDAPLD